MAKLCAKETLYFKPHSPGLRTGLQPFTQLETGKSADLNVFADFCDQGIEDILDGHIPILDIGLLQ